METQLGFRGISLNLIRSYLSNKSQYTKINNYKFYSSNVTCGVPQVSYFFLYINDQFTDGKFTVFEIVSFADDTFLTLPRKNLNSLQKSIKDEFLK